MIRRPPRSTLFSLHDALPISRRCFSARRTRRPARRRTPRSTWSGCGRKSWRPLPSKVADRSEEHTSELQSRQYLVCRLLLEKKKNKQQLGGIHMQKTRVV